MVEVCAVCCSGLLPASREWGRQSLSCVLRKAPCEQCVGTTLGTQQGWRGLLQRAQSLPEMLQERTSDVSSLYVPTVCAPEFSAQFSVLARCSVRSLQLSLGQ